MKDLMNIYEHHLLDNEIDVIDISIHDALSSLEYVYGNLYQRAQELDSHTYHSPNLSIRK